MMGIEKRLLASMFGMWMAFTFAPTNAAMADTALLKSNAPAPRPAAILKLKPTAKPANIRHGAAAGSKVVKASAKKETAKTSHVVASVPHASGSVLRVASVAPSDIKAAVARTSAVKNERSGRIWCVPFAREVSGIDIQGNAKTWWNQADDRYAKGKTPVIGSVLNFRSTRKMPMGHVAVVSHIVNTRTILVDHANWTRNRVSLNMAVVDVSKNNDWSAVRVESTPNALGDVYPTYGFIYNVADRG